MRFDVLKYLIDIDETHSINATAQHFFISQPAISNAIVNLEKSMGVKLLERSAHGAIPTAEGKKVIESAKKSCTNGICSIKACTAAQATIPKKNFYPLIFYAPQV